MGGRGYDEMRLRAEFPYNPLGGIAWRLRYA